MSELLSKIDKGGRGRTPTCRVRCARCRRVYVTNQWPAVIVKLKQCTGCQGNNGNHGVGRPPGLPRTAKGRRT